METEGKFEALLRAAADAAEVANQVPADQARFSDKENKVLARLITQYVEKMPNGKGVISSETWDRICSDFHAETGSTRRGKVQIRTRYTTMKRYPPGKATLAAAEAVRSWESCAPEALLLLASGSTVTGDVGSAADAEVQQPKKLKKRAA